MVDLCLTFCQEKQSSSRQTFLAVDAKCQRKILSQIFFSLDCLVVQYFLSAWLRSFPLHKGCGPLLKQCRLFFLFSWSYDVRRKSVEVQLSTFSFFGYEQQSNSLAKMTSDTSAYEADISCRKRTPVERITRMYTYRCLLSAYRKDIFVEYSQSEDRFQH